ncbi:MAG: hypothetical protein N2044_10610 [Cyclobacteriaceae bacterium]|nr:hypothetical protein [Cyclobacteriaceae bacterium]MCX7638282.1 hypothetical protein [Cyclobacteriaceae bacterium]MDW8330200.1 hypothetical protein [Cyclobacteriaceae bacterium]
MIPRVYIDTSIVGGYFDEEFKDATIKLFGKLQNRKIKFVISDLLELELIHAPKRVRELLHKYPGDVLERVELTSKVAELANKYIEEQVVGYSSIEDCRYIAMATVYRVDVLVSWNFKHILNLNKIRAYNSVNLRFGYPVIEIRSPKEIIDYEND